MRVAPRLPRPLRAQQLRMRGANTLSIEDAWAIALQWQGVLRNAVLLERTQDESVGVAKSYAWILFEIDISNRSKVSAARAAAVAWFALSCCPGYGGHENPVFWKCVFSELARGYIVLNSNNLQSITDAHGFFDGVGMDFPRFKLKVYGDEASALLFLGDPGEELEADDKVKLARVVESLAPCIDQVGISWLVKDLVSGTQSQSSSCDYPTKCDQRCLSVVASPTELSVLSLPSSQSVRMATSKPSISNGHEQTRRKAATVG